MEELMRLLLFIAPMSESLEKHLRSVIKPFLFKSGDVILSPGDVCQRIFYVRKGLIRIYHLLDGQEVSDWFIREGDICISVGSFFDQVASREYHVALEDCECYGVSWDELEYIFTHFPEFNLHGRKISNRYYVELDYRASSLKRQTPYRKYEQLLEKYPDFIGRITNDHMASYLDIGVRNYKKMKADYLKRRKGELAREKRQMSRE